MNSMSRIRLSNSKANSATSCHSETNISKGIIKLMRSTVKCFHHCSSSMRYLCFDLPDKCPTCFEDLKFADIKFKVPPFILPPPITLTNTCLPEFSLLLQPTDGNYSKFIVNNLSDDDIGDLHIGITNTRSEIFDYNSNGLNRNLNRWFMIPSIVIKLSHIITIEQNKLNLELLLNKGSNTETEYDEIFSCNTINSLSLYDKWDLLLEDSWSQRNNKWNKLNYNENELNCFDFVVDFLFDFGYFDFNSEHDEDKNSYLKQLSNMDSFKRGKYLKEKLSNDLIVKEFSKFIRYLKFLVKLEKKKYFVENIRSNNVI